MCAFGIVRLCDFIVNMKINIDRSALNIVLVLCMTRIGRL